MLRIHTSFVQRKNTAAKSNHLQFPTFTTKPFVFTRSASSALPSTPTPVFPNEYEAPKVITEIPGPASKQIMKELDKYQVRLFLANF